MTVQYAELIVCDVKQDEPPDEKELLVYQGGEWRFGYYNQTASQQKGVQLPNELGCAIWRIGSLEGRAYVTHWIDINEVKPK